MSDEHAPDPIEAAFIAAIEAGEIDGDVIELDDEGREIRPRPQPESFFEDRSSESLERAPLLSSTRNAP